MSLTITGLPGYRAERNWTPRRIRRNDQDLVYLPGGKIISGSLSGDAGNTGNVDVLRPGKVMAAAASGGLYRNAIIGKTTAAYVDNDTTLTVSAATATEIGRLITATGGSLALLFVGPPTAAGTVAETAVTITGVASATTVSVADLNLNKVTDSLLVWPSTVISNGSWCFVDDDDYIELSDQDNNRINQQFARPLIGGEVDPAQIVDWPADASTQAWLLGKLSTITGNSQFRFIA
jgi:hypothetical protein